MNTENTEQGTEPFAIVPDALIQNSKWTPSVKLVIVHMLSKYKIPQYTFSCTGIAKATALSVRTVERAIGDLIRTKIATKCGTLMSGKTVYPIYSFNHTYFNAELSNDKLSHVKPLQTLNETQLEGLSNDTSNDNLSDKMSAYKEDSTSKIVQGIKESTKSTITIIKQPASELSQVANEGSKSMNKLSDSERESLTKALNGLGKPKAVGLCQEPKALRSAVGGVTSSSTSRGVEVKQIDKTTKTGTSAVSSSSANGDSEAISTVVRLIKSGQGKKVTKEQLEAFHQALRAPYIDKGFKPYQVEAMVGNEIRSLYAVKPSSPSKNGFGF